MFWLLALVATSGFLGFFGNQAVRLLRESWDGILKADPTTGDIRPTGATALAQELYAMLDDKELQTQVGPVTLNPPPGATALTINQTPPSNAIQLNGGNITLGGGAGITVGPGGTLTLGNAADPGQSAPLTIEGSMNLNGGFYFWNGVPLGLGKGGTGTTVFLGQVVSGSGDTYQVSLFGKGSGQSATATVTATVPQIDPAEEIPAGTWISAVFQFTGKDGQGNTVQTYEFQPPVWLA